MKSGTKHLALALGVFTFIVTTQVASAFYDPNLQRWINRDPIGEHGHKLLKGEEGIGDGIRRRSESGVDAVYSFVRNSPTMRIDPDGLAFVSGPGSSLVNQFYKLQCGLGIVVMIADSYFLTKVCDLLNPGDSVLVPTAGSRIATIPNMAAIIAYCGGPGILVYQVTKGEAGECSAALVVVCLSRNGA